MEIEVYTEGANSFVEKSEAQNFGEYFAGTFTSARGLISNLNNYGEVSVHILDDKYGYVRGSDPIATTPRNNIDRKSVVQKFKSNLIQSARTADVLVVMLSKDVFLETVVPQWDTLSDLSDPANVWCLATSKKALNQIDVKSHLEQAVIIYYRSGVARIGTDTREALIELISSDKPPVEETLYQEFGGKIRAHELLNSS
jgi:hypothetical protein